MQFEMDYEGKFLDYKGQVLDYENVLQLSYMAHNAYLIPDDSKWIDPLLNRTEDVSTNNVQAYVFTNDISDLAVIAVKGTTLRYPLSYTLDDKYNDNLFFSCCFYKQTKLFKKYNDVLTDTCNHQKHRSVHNKNLGKICCKEGYRMSLEDNDVYIGVSNKILSHLNDFLINKTVIFTGHSLGGFLATYMGLISNKTVVTFESPGTRHYLNQSGLCFSKERTDKVYHFGHNADPLFTGRCSGRMSLCEIGGYVIQTKCHIGLVCQYDAMGILGIKESLFTHRINYVINNVISKWNETLPVCKRDDTCSECEDWEYK